MVTVSTLEKSSQAGKLSHCLAISESSVDKDQKLIIGREVGINGVGRTLPRSDVYLDSTCCKADKHLVGVNGARNESSLFSSSLSELVTHNMKLSTYKFLSQKDKVETERQTINNLLPDEEELFTGLVDEMGHMGRVTSDDLDDFDVFTCSGGIELEADDLQANRRNVGYPWGLHHHQQRLGGDTSSYESSRVFNCLPSPVRFPSVRSEFGLSEGNQSFPQVQLDNHCIPSFHPHSPQVRPLNVVNINPRNSLDSGISITNGFCPKVPEKAGLDVHHLGLNGHATELNEGVFGYSPNEIHVHQSMASKSNSYQHHHLRSLLIPNSSSFLNNHHASHLGRLPGDPYLMMNMVSQVQHLQVGSAPVMKASLWDRQQIYTGESHETSEYQKGIIGSVGIPGFSPSHPRDISSYSSFPRVHGTCTEMSKNGGLHSPQQISHIYHERNTMISLPTSFGSPSERVRSRRNETSLSHADRKHYELNIDRILQGGDSRTTLMIKNIPNKYTSKMLLATIDEHHRGKYDFVYLPIDFKNKCNMGYAFINMVDPLQIVAFHQTFEGRKWEKFNSEKVATLAYARIQGKTALISHFQNSSLMNEDKRCRPILFHTEGPNAGDQEPFPTGSSFRRRLKAGGGAGEDDY